MRQPAVALEFDTLLQVDQIERQLLRAVDKGEAGDQCMEQRRLARARATGDEHMMRITGTKLEALYLLRTGATEQANHAELRGALPQRIEVCANTERAEIEPVLRKLVI